MNRDDRHVIEIGSTRLGIDGPQSDLDFTTWCDNCYLTVVEKLERVRLMHTEKLCYGVFPKVQWRRPGSQQKASLVLVPRHHFMDMAKAYDAALEKYSNRELLLLREQAPSKDEFYRIIGIPLTQLVAAEYRDRRIASDDEVRELMETLTNEELS